ncbi:MAG: 6-bladed beta-propeller [Phycisphaerae bacterium]|nr:6-bladed beta-propeller [Phycisphaerae bacterium]
MPQAIKKNNPPSLAGLSVRMVSGGLWVLLILAPLVVLVVEGIFFTEPGALTGQYRIGMLLWRSLGLSIVIGLSAILLGYIPGKILGTMNSSTGRDLLLFILLMLLVLPRHVLYYAWTLLQDPSTGLGQFLSATPQRARFTSGFIASATLILWYWPLAALLISQGWRKIDREILDSAHLEAGMLTTFKAITLPLLSRTLFMAFGVCFVLALSEFATFHLSGIQTVGTELAVMYQLTGSEGVLVRASWPIGLAAVILSVMIGRRTLRWNLSTSALGHRPVKTPPVQWVIIMLLVLFSMILPLGLLVGHIRNFVEFKRFFALHSDGLLWSLLIAVTGAILACLLAIGPVVGNAGKKQSLWNRGSRTLIKSSLLLTMLIPASLGAVGLLKMLSICGLSSGLGQHWLIVSAGLAMRYGGMMLIIMLLAHNLIDRPLAQMAQLDGGTPFQIGWHVHWPRLWPMVAGGFMLVVIFGMTELSATMVLLPAGLPNFSQRLLNQMHYAREQQVIASCVILVGLFLMVAAVLFVLLRTLLIRRTVLVIGVLSLAGLLSGCDKEYESNLSPEVHASIGQTGRGQCEFLYPRAIDIASNGMIGIVDKAGRVQLLNPDGSYRSEFSMPEIARGKPVGLAFHANGEIYLADTHYHRVIVFAQNGQKIREFGSYGEQDGCFIFPTDVAFCPDGRIFVSEFGGHDRVSVFDKHEKFLYSFGTLGNGQGEFSRPASLCVDPDRQRLYVADACNHRIAIYDYDGNLKDYIGRCGTGTGQLRYPYDLAVFPDGKLLVCEYGNNRLQLFSPDGESLALYGQAGRQKGQLAYPWGVAIDSNGRAVVVDSGNNRIQIWDL